MLIINKKKKLWGFVCLLVWFCWLVFVVFLGFFLSTFCTWMKKKDKHILKLLHIWDTFFVLNKITEGEVTKTLLDVDRIFLL